MANGSIVLYGGQAQARPYPGSTTVSTDNGVNLAADGGWALK